MADASIFAARQLKEACKSSGARWAAWLLHTPAGWEFSLQSGLSQPRQEMLRRLLQDARTLSWFAGAINSGRTRWRENGSEAERFGCGRIYLFPTGTKMKEYTSGAPDGMPRTEQFRTEPLEDEPLRSVLLVGTDPLRKEAEAIFKILAMNPPGWMAPEKIPEHGANSEGKLPAARKKPARDGQLAAQLETEQNRKTNSPPTVDAIELEVSTVRNTVSNPQAALQTILEYMANSIPCEAAYLAVRAGNIFRIEACWGCRVPLQGVGLVINELNHIKTLVETHRGVILEAAALLRIRGLPQILDPAPRSWMEVPFVIGQNVIGLASFCTSKTAAYPPNLLQQAASQAGRLAYNVENAIVFAEAARYLQQLALLNELASTASSGIGINEVARRIMQRLRRVFGTEWAAVFLISPEENVLREYGVESDASNRDASNRDASNRDASNRDASNRDGSNPEEEFPTQNQPENPWILPVATSTVSQAVSSGLPVRTTLAKDTSQVSELAVPLKYRGKVIGAIDLMSAEPDAFSAQDEQLLVLIASHLAGLFENMRLNNETMERAKKLQAMVRQLQAVRETALDITSSLDLDMLLARIVRRAQDLVDARGVELGLYNEKEQIVQVVVSETPWQNMIGLKIPLMAGVAGRMAIFGEPLLLADYNTWPGRLLPERNAPFKAVAGVPLKIQGQVIGTLTVMDDRPEKAFHEEDVQLLELLAPQAAISIRNARLYQELQERIEAQRQAESNLIRSARLAAVGEMAAGVAHELNNPLTTVTGFVELVLEDLPAGSTARADLQLVLQESLRARGVVRRLLDFSRPSESRRVRTNISELARLVLTLVRHLVRTNGVTPLLELQPELPWVSVDPNQIQQVILNLVHNALQSMPSGGDLTIRTEIKLRDEDEWVTISVQDSGEGISPENLERIFEPFFTTRGDRKGTGLGLSVSYGIIKSHNGFIEVESGLHQGSLFTVYLPKGEELEDEDEGK